MILRAALIVGLIGIGGCGSWRTSDAVPRGVSSGQAEAGAPKALTTNRDKADSGRDDRAKVPLWVYSANLRGGDFPNGSGINQTLRIQCFVDAFKEHLRTNSADWHLIGIQEAEPVMCPQTHTTMHAADCIATMIADGRSFRVFSKDALALIVNTDVLDVYGDQMSSLIGYSGHWGKQRDVLAINLTIRTNGIRFMFATTHIITAGEGDADHVSSNYCFRRKQIDDLFSQVTQWGMWGGFQVLMTGDFNCTFAGEDSYACDDGLPYGGPAIMTKANSDKRICSLLRSHWTESRNFSASIDQISMDPRHLVGSFQAAGDIGAVSSNGCSDHATAYAVVRTPADTPPPACPSGQKNCATTPGQVHCCPHENFCCSGYCCDQKCVNNKCP